MTKSNTTGFALLQKSARQFLATLAASGCGVLALLSVLASAGEAQRVHPRVAPGSGAPALFSSVSGSLLTWQRLTVDFDGPLVSEQGALNPFRDYRLSVQFLHLRSGLVLEVPGYFAADGDAAETGATTGMTWRAHLAPPLPGLWAYQASFRSGTDVAISLDPQAGVPTSFDGEAGSFTIANPSAATPGFFNDGMLISTGETYLRHAGTAKPFLKFGANSPENFLAYSGFDQTPDGQHQYGPHIADWQGQDPSWHGGAHGKGIIGGLNYLAAKGMNALFMLTFNVGGDGDDVWPWTSKTERLRYDCSKLDQWEIVFEHMDRLGMSMQFVLQEQEIDNGPLALDGGSLGLERKLYQRELLARFGHHLGLIINLGEENQNTTAEQISFYDHLRALDAYGHPIVLHTFPTSIPVVYPPLLAAGVLEGASLQVADMTDVHQTVLDVRQWSLDANRPWAVTLDEIGPPQAGVLPDADDYWHDDVRHHALWGSLMAGSAGAEWYFGYAYPNHDLDCEDWRSRDRMWDMTRAAKDFFESYLAFDAMIPADELVLSGSAWCLADAGTEYALYLPAAEEVILDLQNNPGSFDVSWFDASNGGELLPGSVTSVTGPGPVSLGLPQPGGVDWAVLVAHVNSQPEIELVAASPDPYTGDGILTFGVVVEDPDGMQDLVSVTLSVLLPDGTVLFTVPLINAGGSLWSMTYVVPGVLQGGSWFLATQALDSAGNSDKEFGSFLVL